MKVYYYLFRLVQATISIHICSNCVIKLNVNSNGFEAKLYDHGELFKFI